MTINNYHPYITMALYLCFAAISSLFYDFRYRDYHQDKEKQAASVTSFRIAYRYIQVSTIVLTILSLFYPLPQLGVLYHSTVAMYGGCALAGVGMAVFVAARLNLGASYSPCFDAYLPKTIVAHGIYGYVRHPIYLANLLLVTGCTLSTGSIFLALNLVVLIAYYQKSARIEESALEQTFPEYVRYRQATGRFIPQLSRHIS